MHGPRKRHADTPHRSRSATGGRAAPEAHVRRTWPTPRRSPARPRPTTTTAGRRAHGIVPSHLSAIVAAVTIGASLFMGGFTLGAHVATTPGTPADEETRFGPFWDIYTLIQKRIRRLAPSPARTCSSRARSRACWRASTTRTPTTSRRPTSRTRFSTWAARRRASVCRSQLQPVDPHQHGSLLQDRRRLRAGGRHAHPGLARRRRPACKAGDVIVSVDGKSLDGLTVDETTKP